MFEDLTRFLPMFEQTQEYGKVIADKEHTGTVDDPIQWPFVAYNEVVYGLEDAIYAFQEAHPDFELNHYHDILERSGLKWDMSSMSGADPSALDGQAIMALLVGAVRAERFCDGALLEFCESGS
ncbi:MAG: hypothetical protein J6D25_06365, partial [Eggerthellaceae bacterium]|nr:hypothetical protein [Eggerthellaceae bacterium]